jgi:hypothetical protein
MNPKEQKKIMDVLISMNAESRKLHTMKQLSLNSVNFAIEAGLDPAESLVALATTVAVIGKVSEIPLRELVSATVKCYEDMYANPNQPTMQ